MTHLPAVVEVADFAVVEVAAYVPVVAYVLVVSRAVAAIAWPEDLGSHPIARPPIAGRPGAPDRWCAGPSDSRVSWLRLARRRRMELPPSVPQRRRAPACLVTTTTTITAATRTPTAIGSARVSTRIIGSEVERARRLRRGQVVATLALDPLIAFAISATGARSTGGALGLTVPSSVLVR